MCYHVVMADASPKQEKILIIEGDGAFGEKVVEALKQDGYANAFLVKNGTEGLKSIYDILPHIILLDITLPGMDGYQILAQKQAEQLLAKIPVFLISTQGVPINMRNVPAGAVAEFMMSLHVNPEDIVVKVDRYLGHESSRPGGGSAGPVSASTASGGGSADKKKVLWVEDDKLIGTILAKKLITSGFDLYHAKNGEEALETLKTVKPDGIVVDLILPGMSGFDILQRVKMDPGLQHIPSMVLSNLSKPSDIEKAKVLGAKKFLVKAATSLDQIVFEVKELCK